ncbi:hypothetical protein KI387_018526, partial [Taxus chinensis]
ASVPVSQSTFGTRARIWPCKGVEERAAEREEIGEVFAAFESLCSLLQTPSPIPASPTSSCSFQ